MSAAVADLRLSDAIERARRQACGTDRWDEVWDGEYILMPLPNDEHQAIVSRLIMILELLIGLPGLGRVRPGVNVSDRDADWITNYRCPDIVVFRHDTAAENRGTHWLGGPDFVVEIVSAGDRTWDKLPFYEQVGVGEVLIIDRDPWSLELYRREGDRLQSVGCSDLVAEVALPSSVVPLEFRLRTGTERPQIQVRHRAHEQTWLV